MDNEKIEEQKAKATRTLATMLDYLGLNAQLKAEEKGSKIVITIASDEAGRIIGRKGQTLESLQLLLNRMVFNSDQDCPRIALDIDGYAAPRGGDGEERGGDRRGGGRRRSGRDGGSFRGSRDNGPREGGGEEAPSDDILRQQALDAAKEAKRWGEEVTLPRMNAHDRRIIHITLQDDPEVATESIGEGALKKVVISIKK